MSRNIYHEKNTYHIPGGIATYCALIVFSAGDFSTYGKYQFAQKAGTFVLLGRQTGKTEPIVYDAINNPNYLPVFMWLTSLGGENKGCFSQQQTNRPRKSKRML
ncbi:MAG: hypothetical protein IPH68_15680 [Chitinophagaceae bacterium]|nr:hypothetical protein [Chitinophagaceae bacterium]